MKHGRASIPPNPIISNAEVISVRHQDTLNNVAAILELMDDLDLSEGLSSTAANGLFWINMLLISAVRYVSEDIKGCQVKRSDQ